MYIGSMLKTALSSALAVAVAGTGPAYAQDDDSNDIVVIGQREVSVRELRQQADAITPRENFWGEPLARFHEPVCAGVWGMTPESAQVVIDRIYYNAENIGLPVVREEGCEPNVIVAVAEDADEEFQAMRDERHPLVRGLDFWERKRVLRYEDGPVLAWNVIQPGTFYGAVQPGRPPVVESTMASRTFTSTTNRIMLSIVMIDRAAAGGLDAVSLADYTTMRAFAYTRPPSRDVAVGTILSLFDGDGDNPGRLSAFDRAYLAGVYDSPENRPMRMAMGTIGTRLRQELASEE